MWDFINRRSATLKELFDSGVFSSPGADLSSLTEETGVDFESFAWSDEYGGYCSSGLGGVRPAIRVTISY